LNEFKVARGRVGSGGRGVLNIKQKELPATSALGGEGDSYVPFTAGGVLDGVTEEVDEEGGEDGGVRVCDISDIYFII